MEEKKTLHVEQQLDHATNIFMGKKFFRIFETTSTKFLYMTKFFT